MSKKAVLFLFLSALFIVTITVIAEPSDAVGPPDDVGDIVKVDGVTLEINSQLTVSPYNSYQYLVTLIDCDSENPVIEKTYSRSYGHHHIYHINKVKITNSSINTITFNNSLLFVSNSICNCQNLEKIVFNGAPTLEDGAIVDCPKLTSVTCYYNSDITGASFKNIGNCVVVADSQLVAYYAGNPYSEYVVPDHITEIKSHAFKGVTNLKKIIIPSTVIKIGDYAFKEAPLMSVTISKCALDHFKTVFYECNDIVEVNLVEGIEDIVDSTFMDCKGIKIINLPSSLSSIGNDVFSGCINLSSIEIPLNVNTIGNGAFSGCKSLNSIKLPSNIMFVGHNVFENCPALESVNIHSYALENFKTIFSQNPYIKNVNVMDGVTVISDCAFSDCKSLERVHLASTVLDIKDHAFDGCSALFDVNLPTSILNIGNYAFNRCQSITSINLPSNVNSIGINAFSDCTALTYITVDNQNTVFSSDRGILFNKEGTDLILCPCGYVGIYNMPFGVNTIEDCAFKGCTFLTEVIFPTTVKSIGNYAFHGCTLLGSVNLPSSLLILGKNAFSYPFYNENGSEILNSISGYGFTLNSDRNKFLLTSVETGFVDLKTKITITEFLKYGVSVSDLEINKEGYVPKLYFDNERLMPVAEGYIFTEPGKEVYYEFEVLKFTILWKNYDGTLLEKDENIPYGSIPEYNGAIPVRSSTPEFDYEFSGWGPEADKPIVNDIELFAAYSSEIRKYVICFDIEGELFEQILPFGETPYFGYTPVKKSDAKYTYSFKEWNPVIKKVDGPQIYTALFNGVLNTYDVIWKNYDGTVLEIDSGVPYGEVPEYNGQMPFRESSSEYTYSFKGWNPVPVCIVGDTVLKAQFESIVNDYTVSWKNFDGTVLEVDEKVPYGTIPEYNGETPIRAANNGFVYKFSDWNAITGNKFKVIEDTVLVAEFDEQYMPEQEFVITFVVDGISLEQKLMRGELPSYGSVPVKEADPRYTYVFREWSPSIEPVNGPQTYVALFNELLNKYEVTWTNFNGAILERDVNVPYGTVPEYNGSTPIKESDIESTYAFAGWDLPIEPIAGDKVFKAQFESTVREYSVIWKNYDGRVLETDVHVAYGTVPEYNGGVPFKAADPEFTYSFKGWQSNTTGVESIKGDTVFTAVYSSDKRSYVISFIVDDDVTEQTIAFGDMPDYGSVPVRNSNAEFSYSFKNWTPSIMPVSGSQTYTASFNEIIRCYSVTWKNYDGSVLKMDNNVPYGTVSENNDVPVKGKDAQFSYVFKEWVPSPGPIHGDTVYTAEFGELLNKYDVIWKNHDGEILETDQDVPYGSVPQYNGQVPLKTQTPEYEYSFSGWDLLNEGNYVIKGHTELTAEFTSEKRIYSISFNVDGNTVEQKIPYGEVPTYGSIPSKVPDAQFTYSFKEWVPSIRAVDGNEAYCAEFNESLNKYSITWKNYDGTTLSSEYGVEYGTLPEYSKEAPTKNSDVKFTYSFNEWYPAIKPIHGDTTYTATFTATLNKYTVAWKNYDGSVLKIDDDVEYGTIPKYDGDEPTRESTSEYSYIFNGVWSSVSDTVVGDMTYVAVLDEVPNIYEALFIYGIDDDLRMDIGFGSEIPVNLNPEKKGYRFIEWIPAIPNAMPARDMVFNAVWTFEDISENGVTTEYDKVVEGDISKESSITDLNNGVKVTIDVSSDSYGCKTNASVTIDKNGFKTDAVHDAILKMDSEIDKMNAGSEASKMIVFYSEAGSLMEPGALFEVGSHGEDLTIETDVGTVLLSKESCLSLGDCSSDMGLIFYRDFTHIGNILNTIGNKTCFDLILDGNDSNGVLGGKAKVTVDYDLKNGQTQDNICVYYVDEDGSKEPVKTTYEDGKLSFETEHFSVFMVDVLPIEESGSDADSKRGSYNEAALGVMIVGGSLIISLLLAITVMMFVRKR